MRSQHLCTQFMKSIMSNKNAGPFNEPVDYMALGVPDYPNIISQPMDFGTIEKKLAAGQYSTVEQLAAECRLVFTNARTFNPPDHIIHKMASDLSRFFDKKLDALQSKMDSNELGGGSTGANKEWARTCKKILKAVQDHPESYPFLQPVDWKKLGIPDYPKIVKKPMDLSRVERRLAQMHYSSAEGFVAEMSLIFGNAMLFNLEGSQIHLMAQNVQQTFHAKCAELLGSAPAAAAGGSARKSSKRKHREHGAPREAPSQKRVLNKNLGQLRSAELGQMVDMVKERCPGCIAQTEDDQIEIDLDRLHPSELGAIASFVSACVESY
eukprot:TRINITY_DN6646_c0_g1_i2.p1 TRINITY_DN6646_c0_g1~~TRINITY_DN6646_c0_g1_i2.p1  ORF type:complete len:324 (+),score=107.78 TRINITY_DN6646_c0_g1_i2:178-1149(+)